MTQYNTVHRTLAGVAFLAALVTYTLTLQPSVAFWDCGEFSAAMALQQVQHPPGAPLWSLVGRMIQMLPIGDPGWTSNLAAGVCSAFTGLLAYLIGVLVMERFRPYREDRPLANHIPVFGGALIGALAFVWSDSQWFNSVESEVYSAATLLCAILVWLMLRWDRKAGQPGHERYLLMMAYVIGLAIGTHLLALLVYPAIAMVIYFRHFKFDLKTFLALIVITGVSFFGLVYNAPLEYIPKLLSDNAVIGVILLAGLIGLVVWAARERKPIIYVSTMSFLLIILGYTTYTQVMIRSNAHTPLNFGEPNTFKEIVDYLGRKQYGNRNTWPRRVEIEQYYRNYQDKYGEWFMPVGQNKDGTYIFDQINTAGELNFMVQYQIYHMYFRYLLWNFVGRVSDMQDAPPAMLAVSPDVKARFIAQTGYDDVFPIQFFALPLLLGLFGLYYHYKRDWKMAFVFTALFLFLGVFSALQQKQQQPQPRERDYFYAASFMIFAVWIGLGATGLAERVSERRTVKAEDATVVDDGAPRVESSNGATYGILGLCLVAVPLLMAFQGWRAHDRSGNWVPWDYAYNILQSCEKDAILFTNGDNDTFPLWYMQDVAGVRRDIRVVNLSLGQMPWYIRQLKKEKPWGAKPLRVTTSDQELDAMEASDGGVKAEDLVRDIVKSNSSDRPIYFCTSINEPKTFAGFEDYFRQEGLAYRIMPEKQERNGIIGYAVNTDVMRQSLMNTLPDGEYFREPHYGFKFRNLANHDVFFMEDHRRIPTANYRVGYLALAYEMIKANNPTAAVMALDKMGSEISEKSFPIPYSFLAQVSNLYKQANASAKAAAYARKTLDAITALGPAIADDPNVQQAPPDVVRAEMLVNMGDYDGAISIYQALAKQYPGNATELRGQIEDLQIQKLLAKNDTAAAAAELRKLIAAYTDTADAMGMRNRTSLQARLNAIGGRAPALPDNTSTRDTGASQQSRPSTAR
jgi:hypothetical protein